MQQIRAYSVRNNGKVTIPLFFYWSLTMPTGTLTKNIMAISYRKLLPRDSAQYREIRLESLKAHPESFGSTFEEQKKLPKLMFEKAIEQPYDSRFVVGAFDQKEIIGICGFVPFASEYFQDLENAGTIIQMYVKPTYRGRRIGFNLVKTVVDEAFRLPDIDKVVLGVKEGNLSAIRVYEQAGFLNYSPAENETERHDDSFRTMMIHRSIWK
jgi:RimJ/RimL family protein N-acetyltransferase